MEPLQETVDVLRSLSSTSEHDLLAMIQDLAATVQGVVPECVGLSITLVDSGLTFTLAASSDRVAALDAVQYLVDGPCIGSASGEVVVELEDVLDEERWQHFARSASAQGVRSTLSLPLVVAGEVAGAVNLYAADPRAFAGREDRLREVVGAGPGLSVSNADLTFRTREDARRARATLTELDEVEQAVGFLVAEQHVPADEARRLLVDAAARAGVDVASAARALMSRR